MVRIQEFSHWCGTGNLHFEYYSMQASGYQLISVKKIFAV